MASVHHTIEAHVATVVLSNEARMNAMSLAMWRQLAETLAQLQASPEVREGWRGLKSLGLDVVDANTVQIHSIRR